MARKNNDPAKKVRFTKKETQTVFKRANNRALARFNSPDNGQIVMVPKMVNAKRSLQSLRAEELKKEYRFAAGESKNTPARQPSKAKDAKKTKPTKASARKATGTDAKKTKPKLSSANHQRPKTRSIDPKKKMNG